MNMQAFLTSHYTISLTLKEVCQAGSFRGGGVQTLLVELEIHELWGRTVYIILYYI